MHGLHESSNQVFDMAAKMRAKRRPIIEGYTVFLTPSFESTSVERFCVVKVNPGR
jgi:hypothetical protein